MNQKLENKLSNDFSFMKARNVWTGELCEDENEEPYGFPCECGDGWYQLIHDLCQELTDFYTEHNADTNTIFVMQIKEKFGELRFYHNGLIKGAEDIIDKYCNKSLETCEVCGGGGALCVSRHWLRTLCENHMNEYKYKRCKEV